MILAWHNNKWPTFHNRDTWKVSYTHADRQTRVYFPPKWPWSKISRHNNTNRLGPVLGFQRWPEIRLCRRQREIQGKIRERRGQKHTGPGHHTVLTPWPCQWQVPEGTSTRPPSSRRLRSPENRPTVFSENSTRSPNISLLGGEKGSILNTKIAIFIICK